jgi:paraquat-inducible protein B
MNVRNEISVIKSSWFIWIFPVFAIAVCGWLLFNHMKDQGPKIKIAFEDGGSLQPEKTRIRYRGVTIGVVKKVEISEDGKHVLATAVLDKSAEHFAVKGSKYWIVSPKVTFQGVSGLETLIEGNYIAAQPGKPDAEEQLEFDGKVDNDTSEALDDTIAYNLEAKNVESVNVGDSVTFRGLKIGTVSRVNLAKSSQTVLVQINVENKYVKVIRTNTVFWRKVAVNANLGLFNSEVKINSLDSILRGGIELFTPDGPGEIAKARSKFALNENPPKGWEKWNPALEFPEK